MIKVLIETFILQKCNKHYHDFICGGASGEAQCSQLNRKIEVIQTH
jgi:hypothetical protein